MDNYPWDWGSLCLNKDFFELSTKRIEKTARKYFAQKKIARYWRECISNPEYKICQRRLIREFQELV
jgi:hypothetical protein